MTTTITIHFVSLGVGFIAGMLVMGIIFLQSFYDNRWSDGFNKGQESGEKYGEMKNEIN